MPLGLRLARVGGGAMSAAPKGRARSGAEIDPAVLGTPAAPAAHREYDAQRAAAFDLLERIGEALEALDHAANDDPTDWAHAGSMAHLVRLLTEVDNFARDGARR
jgi:hypothetical protein